jgi:glutathione synthase
LTVSLPMRDEAPGLGRSDADQRKVGEALFFYIESNTSGTGEIFLRSARNCGFTPVFITSDRNRYSFLTSVLGLEIEDCDTSNRQDIENTIRRSALGRQIVGIYSTSEFYIATAAELARRFALPGPDPERVATARDKSCQRELVAAAEGELCPKFFAVRSVEDAGQMAQRIGYPVVLKPVSGSGSINVRRCDTHEEVIAQARKIFADGGAALLVEELINGREVSVELFNGEAIGVTHKDLGPPPFFVEMGHVFPADMAAHDHSAAVSAAERVAEILGIDWGPAHIELKLSATGPKLIELNPRLAGDMIPELVHEATGRDLVAATILLAAGRPWSMSADKRDVAAIGFVAPEREGTLAVVKGIDAVRRMPGVVNVTQIVPTGTRLRLRGESGDRVVRVIVKAKNHTSARQLLNKAVAGIAVTTEDHKRRKGGNVMRATLLVNSLQHLDENHAFFANAFIRLGWDVVMADVNRIFAVDYRYFVVGACLPKGYDKYEAGGFIRSNDTFALDESNIAWILNQPQPSVSRDVWQILWLASQTTNFVNSIEGLMFLNTKHSLGYVLPKKNRTPTYISNDFSYLWEHYRKEQNSRWVAKPLNSGCGQDVFLLPQDGSNVRTILQSLTGNTVAAEEMSGANLTGFNAEYAMLQGYIKEVKNGEKRVIVACDKVVAWHGRTSQPDDHRSNITQGGTPVDVKLSKGERALAELIGRKLMEHGVHFCGIDMAYPYVLELNIANPGGLGDYRLVSGNDMSDEVVKTILAKFKNQLSKKLKVSR